MLAIFDSRPGGLGTMEGGMLDGLQQAMQLRQRPRRPGTGFGQAAHGKGRRKAQHQQMASALARARPTPAAALLVAGLVTVPLLLIWVLQMALL